MIFLFVVLVITPDEQKEIARLRRELRDAQDALDVLKKAIEYYGAAEPPVRCGESHLSGLTEPPHFVY